jgi:hypothetical protein
MIASCRRIDKFEYYYHYYNKKTASSLLNCIKKPRAIIQDDRSFHANEQVMSL